MTEQYLVLSQEEAFEILEKNDQIHRPVRKLANVFGLSLTRIMMFFLIFTNGVMLFILHDSLTENNVPADYARPLSTITTWKSIYWWTNYSHGDRTEREELWDAILPSHGFVAVDRQWAASQQWPESMRLPSDEEKGVYLLEAYHQLYCLKMIRRTFWEAVEGRPYTEPPTAHMEHCFDALRQAIQCYADATPLYTFGQNTAGDGQLHRCGNWDDLRDFATQHTACYRDTTEEVLLKEHFGFCVAGTDGLLWDVSLNWSQ